MKKFLHFFILLCLAVVFSVVNVSVAYADDDKIYLGGMAAGFSLSTKGAEVIGVCDVITENGVKSPSKNCGIQAGDIIEKIGEYNTDSAEDIALAIKDGGEKKVIIDRRGEKITANVNPEKDLDGYYKLGVFIRDKINGIGTITFIRNNRFASLGHPILRSDGSLMGITGGELYDCSVNGCVKGERGKAGELHGVFSGKSPNGTITENRFTGVYGTLSENYKMGELKEIETGEGTVGDASIFSTVNSDGIKEYKISIIKVDGDNKSNKNFVVKINDESLIEATGGIVQGMSGSPVVQNGKLIGAITHVFINDPTRGFAISINNMLNN